jgi:hypothetical protein
VKPVWAVLALALAWPAAAETVRPMPRPQGAELALPEAEATPRPQARPVVEAPPSGFMAAAAAEPPSPRVTSPRPLPRPAGLAGAAGPEVPVETAAVAAALVPDGTVRTSMPRPKVRPRDLDTSPAPEPAAVVRVRPTPEATQPKRGSVCGDRAIRGETIPPIRARTKGCGVDDPVRVTEVDGVRLSVPITVDCPTAVALKSWVKKGLKPAIGRAGVAELKIAAHYACRTRNNRPGAPISEHGRGKAVDISAIVLGNGKVIEVLSDYRRSKPLKAAHRAACGVFGTTLGPGSDGYHENHLHFDTARHRSGPYCR